MRNIRHKRRYLYSSIGAVPLLIGASHLPYENAAAEPTRIERPLALPQAETAPPPLAEEIQPPERPAVAAGESELGAGEASYYGAAFAGRPTASGEIFDPAKLTAAHRTLPLGSLVRVTHVESGRSVVVRINDRGPYHGDRVIDLSRAAADEIGLAAAGTGHVRLSLIPG
ncbi:MAG: septal ring lytic transglycosylase RlpA family protein [Sphingomonadaceae bacterium]